MSGVLARKDIKKLIQQNPALWKVILIWTAAAAKRFRYYAADVAALQNMDRSAR